MLILAVTLQSLLLGFWESGGGQASGFKRSRAGGCVFLAKCLDVNEGVPVPALQGFLVGFDAPISIDCLTSGTGRVNRRTLA